MPGYWYDGHTLAKALKQGEFLAGFRPRYACAGWRSRISQSNMQTLSLEEGPAEAR